MDQKPLLLQNKYIACLKTGFDFHTKGYTVPLSQQDYRLLLIFYQEIMLHLHLV